MKTQDTNRYGVKVGDVIRFTNSLNFEVVVTVKRVTETSCFTNGRKSWGTVNEWIEKFNAKIN